MTTPPRLFLRVVVSSSLLLLALAVPPEVAAQNVTFPAGSGVVSVKSPPYNAVGNGIADDTAALQAAITDSINTDRVLFIPNGTYLLTNTLTYPGNSKRVTLQGESRTGTVLKLQNGLGFTGPVLNLTTSTSTGQAFRNQIFDLTVDIGSGNPGATGIRFISNNQGGMRNVTIRSSATDKAGNTGLSLTAQWPGPSMFRNVTVDGFNYGVYSSNREYSHVFENLTLTNQKLACIRNVDNILTIRGLTTSASCPVLINSSENSNIWGMVTILDATLTGLSGASGQNALTNLSGTVYLRNVTSTGYALLLNNNAQGGGANLPNGQVAEYGSFNTFRNNATNTIVLRNLALNNLGGTGYAYTNAPVAGKLFIEDVLAYRSFLITEQQVWARQWNVESYSAMPHITNVGGTIWILGLKTEKGVTIVDNQNGGKLELLGGLGISLGQCGRQSRISEYRCKHLACVWFQPVWRLFLFSHHPRHSGWSDR